MELTFTEALEKQLEELDRRYQRFREKLADVELVGKTAHERTGESLLYQADRIIELKKTWLSVRELIIPVEIAAEAAEYIESRGWEDDER